MNAQLTLLGRLLFTTSVLAACGADATDGPDAPIDGSQPAVDPAHFVAGGLKGAITTTSCTLSGGTTTTCYKIVTVGAPSNRTVGPFVQPRSPTAALQACGSKAAKPMI